MLSNENVQHIEEYICEGMDFCEAQDAHLDWRLIGEAVGHIALTNISSEESAIGIYLNSSPTIKFVRGFVDKYYDKFLAEYEVAPSIYDPSKFMKNNVGAAFESENEKSAMVWDSGIILSHKLWRRRICQCGNV